MTRFAPALLLKSLLLAVIGAMLFAGCCGSVACNCDDERVDALLFQFDSVRTSATSFRDAEVDTILLVRSVYPRDSVRTSPGVTASKPDTVRIVRALSEVRKYPIIIDNSTPFASVNGRKLGFANPDSSYRYTIIVPGPRRNSPPVKRYYLGRVQLQGRNESDGCCACYRNTVKKFTLRDLDKPASTTVWVDAYSAPNTPRTITTLRR